MKTLWPLFWLTIASLCATDAYRTVPPSSSRGAAFTFPRRTIAHSSPSPFSSSRTHLTATSKTTTTTTTTAAKHQQPPIIIDNASPHLSPDPTYPTRPPLYMPWSSIQNQLKKSFNYTDSSLNEYTSLSTSKPVLTNAYRSMLLSRLFENACSQQYMNGKIRGFMHLDNGQESIPSLLSHALTRRDIKYSYYREHTHALASGVSPESIMAELMMKDTGTCRGAGGSMHIFDAKNYFQGGWALVSEQLPYAAGAAKSILQDRALGIYDAEDLAGKKIDDDDITHGNYNSLKNDKRIAVVMIGEGGSQNGRMAEVLNAAAKDKLPLLIVVIDNGRAINTFTPDVAFNSDIYKAGAHYGIPGILVDGSNVVDVIRGGQAVVDYVREGKGAAIIQVHTYRFNGHSPADPEHEDGRKMEKKWARAEQDPIAIFERNMVKENMFSKEELAGIKKEVQSKVKDAVKFADDSPEPPPMLAKELEYPDRIDTDYNTKPLSLALGRDSGHDLAQIINDRTISSEQMEVISKHVEMLQAKGVAGEITIGDAINLAIHEEMLRDPTTTIHAEDLRAGSSYDVPKLTYQTYGGIRASDEIIDEGHFIGKALGEAMNGYRPIVELMNTNFGIYGMAELASAGNTYATSGGRFKMPMTIIGAGGTAPNQSLGAEHSQPFHAYVMGIPGLKILTASSPAAAYGITKSMIRDDGPCFMFAPVKMMKEAKGVIDVGRCLPLNKSELLHQASEECVENRKAATVLTYLHGVKEAQIAIEELAADGFDIDLIELRSLKPLDMETIKTSLKRTNKLVILDESTKSGGVGASISAAISEELFDLLDQPIKRLCMDDAPVPYSTSMEKAVVKRAEDLVDAVQRMILNK